PPGLQGTRVRGLPGRLTFLRTTEHTCRTEVPASKSVQNEMELSIMCAIRRLLQKLLPATSESQERRDEATIFRFAGRGRGDGGRVSVPAPIRRRPGSGF